MPWRVGSLVRMSKVLVTGCTGYLGRAVARACSRRGINHFGIARSGDLSPIRHAMDVRDEAAVRGWFEWTHPHLVIHTAYVQSGPEARDIIVNGSAVVARATAALRRPLVHVSTDVVFDGRLGRPYRVDDTPNPITEYGRHKLEAERAVREACPWATIVRTSLLHGGDEPSNHERLAIEPGDTTFFTDEIRCPTNVNDLADALLHFLDRRGPPIVHLVGADAVSRLEFAQIVRAANGLDPTTLRGAKAADLGIDRPLDLRLEPADLRGLWSSVAQRGLSP